MAVNFGGLGEMGNSLIATDPTLSTCSPAEAAIRQGLSFTDIQVTFPKFGGGGMFAQLNSFLLQENSITFPAYIKTFKDNFKPTWNSVKVFGRPDSIPVYERTERTISLAFSIPCYDKHDAAENLKKVNKFTSNLYPSYNKIGSPSDAWVSRAFGMEDDPRPEIMSTPPLIRIKFANLILSHSDGVSGLLGYVTSFTSDLNIPQKGVFLKGPRTSSGAILPRAIDISFTFTVLHERTPGWDVATKDFIGRGTLMGGEYPYNTPLTFGGLNPEIGGSADVDSDVATHAITGNKL